MFKRNAVVDQNANNFLKTTKNDMGCCGDNGLNCQYTATYTQSDSVTAITIIENAVDKVLTLAIAANATAAAVKTAITTALVAAGYYDDDNRDWPGIIVTDLGSTLQIVITGDINVKSLTASGGASTFDADCTILNACTYVATAFTAGAGSIMKLNGVSRSIGDITAGTTTASTVKTSVEAALLAGGITAVATVTTNGSGGTQTYNISIASIPSKTTIYFVGASAVRFNADRTTCVQTYV